MERVADLGAHTPGAVAHAEGIDLDRLVADPDRAAVAAGLIEMTAFILILAVTLVYAWKKGALEWEK